MPESDQATIVADDPTATPSTTEHPEADANGAAEPEDMGEITEVVLDDLDGMSLSDAIDATLVSFDEGGLVTGTVVKVAAVVTALPLGSALRAGPAPAITVPSTAARASTGR